jgi:hypothetical protein
MEGSNKTWRPFLNPQETLNVYTQTKNSFVKHAETIESWTEWWVVHAFVYIALWNDP